MPTIVWAKTDAGRAEMQNRSVVKERALRNLLLLVDGTKTEAALLAAVAGIGADDLHRLEALGLIAPVVVASRGVGAPAAGASAHNPGPGAAPTVAPSPAQGEAAPTPALDYSAFTAALTQMISRELGLRGFALTLAVEKASTPDELRGVAERVIAQIGERKGPDAAGAARRALFGG